MEDVTMEEEEQSESSTHAVQYIGESDFEQAGSESESDLDNPEISLHQAISNIPLATLAKVQKKLKPTTRALPQEADEQVRTAAKEAMSNLKKHRKGRLEPRFQSALQGTDQIPVRESDKGKEKASIQRSNKHAPMEMSSKRAVGRARTIIETPKAAHRDPRFDALSGSLSNEAFNASYAFLHENKRTELAKLQEAASRAKKNANLSNKDKEELQREVVKAKTRLAQEEKDAREGQVIREWKKKEDALRQEGKKAFHLKRSQKKTLFADSKLQELSKDKRKLKKHQQRKEQRQTQKDRKEIPAERVGFE